MKLAAALALLLAYVPSSASLLKHAAARAQMLARTKEVTLSGTLEVRGEPLRTAHLVLRFPLQCKLDGEGGISYSVKGTVDNPGALGEGTAGPALRLLQLACPFLAYKGIPSAEAPQALRAAAQAAGADVGAAASVTRFGDQVAYVLGAAVRDLASPQLWLYKDTAAPARLIAQGGADLRLLEYGNPAAGEWFPRVVELWTSGQLAARFEVLESKGARAAAQAEEDDSRE
jgi:hypothetical protein